MMGNRKIKIIPVKTGCWKSGNRVGLQGWLAAEGCWEQGGSHTASLGQNTQFPHVEAHTKAMRQRQHSSAGSRLGSCVPQNMTDYGYLHQCVHSPSLNTCLNSFLLDEGHNHSLHHISLGSHLFSR